MFWARTARWFGSAALVAGLLVAAPTWALATEEPSECFRWEGKIEAVTPIGPGQVRMEGRAAHEGALPACSASVFLVGYSAKESKGHWNDWYTEALTGKEYVAAKGKSYVEFDRSLTLGVGTHAVCVVTPANVALDCLGVTVAIDPATGQPGTPVITGWVGAPVDKAGKSEDGGGECGTCV